MKILVIQHIECEPAGSYAVELENQGGELLAVEIDQGDELPDWRHVDGIVAMGGPMGAYEDERCEWLGGEKMYLSSAVRAGVPYWGVCLGAQLLAASLGAPVFRGRVPEVGVHPVILTQAGRQDVVFGAAPNEFSALHWHGDTFQLPEGSTHLARSVFYDHQAFSWGHAYGLQFHLEAGVDLVARWLDVHAYANSLQASPLAGEGGPGRLLDSLAPAAATSDELARRLFTNWLRFVVRPAMAA